MREQRPKPKPWREQCQKKALRWAYPFRALNWLLEWVAWALGGWVFLEVLEYLSMFSVLVAVILYFSESGDRIKQRHYQAWQVIDAAQGKGGNGGRIEAMQELNHDGVSLVGIQADNAFLLGIRLKGGHLDRCDMDASDLRNSVFDHATLTFCNLQSTNFREASHGRNRPYRRRFTGLGLHRSQSQSRQSHPGRLEPRRPSQCRSSQDRVARHRIHPSRQYQGCEKSSARLRRVGIGRRRSQPRIRRRLERPNSEEQDRCARFSIIDARSTCAFSLLDEILLP